MYHERVAHTENARVVPLSSNSVVSPLMCRESHFGGAQPMYLLSWASTPCPLSRRPPPQHHRRLPLLLIVRPTVGWFLLLQLQLLPVRLRRPRHFLFHVGTIGHSCGVDRVTINDNVRIACQLCNKGVWNIRSFKLGSRFPIKEKS
jgi:hypothetical protein